jgi:transcriptional regulator GlxA family with amidase domain
MKIHLLVLPRVLDASLGISLSLFQTANTLLSTQGRAPLFKLSLTAMRAGIYQTGAGLPLTITRAISDLPTPDLVLLPGSYLTSESDMESWLIDADVQAACAYLARLSTSDKRGKIQFAAACAGTFVFAQAGLLEARQATTIWWLRHPFQKRFPNTRLDMHRMVVQDANIITSGAALAQSDLLLHIIAKQGGAQLAHTCARYLMLDERASQGSYAMVQQQALQNPQLRQAEQWLRTRLHKPVRITELAAALNLTPRTLARRFEQALGLTPLQFVQRLRIEHALYLLQSSSQTLEAIALQVGYAEPNALRRLLVRELGVTPAQFRRQAGKAKD